MYIAMTFEVLKFLLPAIIFYFTARMVVGSFMRNESLKREAGMKKENHEIILPLRLQAYERLILLLERISPQQAVSRILQPGMSAIQFQLLLTHSIREEFEHNIAQQVYVSAQGWALVRSAKEEIIRLVNTVSASTDSKVTGNDLAQMIVEKSAEWEPNPVQMAIEQLKSEVSKMF